jgi:hypothetical protein
MRTTLFYRMSRTALRPTTRSLYPETRLFSASASTTLKDSYEYIQVEQKESGVGLIRLHRPKAMNALSDALFQDLIHAATALDQDDSVGCLVLTGSTKAFAAGADIAEMKDRTFDYTYKKVRGRQMQCRVCILYCIGDCIVCVYRRGDKGLICVWEWMLLQVSHADPFLLYDRTCLASGQTLLESPSL